MSSRARRERGSQNGSSSARGSTRLLTALSSSTEISTIRIAIRIVLISVLDDDAVRSLGEPRAEEDPFCDPLSLLARELIGAPPERRRSGLHDAGCDECPNFRKRQLHIVV